MHKTLGHHTWPRLCPSPRPRGLTERGLADFPSEVTDRIPEFSSGVNQVSLERRPQSQTLELVPGISGLLSSLRRSPLPFPGSTPHAENPA